MLQLQQYGGYSSVAERRSVAADVVGSKPTSRPKLLKFFRLRINLAPRTPSFLYARPGRRCKAPSAPLCWDVRLGVSNLEAGVLSCRHAREEVPSILWNTTDFSRSELHLPCPADGEDARGLA